LHTPSDRFNFERQRDRLDSGLSGINEFWIRAEDWAERVADNTMALSHKGILWLEARPTVVRWSIVFASVLLATVIGVSMQENVTASSQLLLFLPAVMLSALYGGAYAGTIASLLGAFATVEWKMSPQDGTLAQDIVGLCLYFVACGIMLGLSSAQKRQRAQIIDFADTLETKIQERTADLETVNDELSGFCYSISHDLRAPMRNIVGSSRILIEEAGDRLDADSKQRLYSLATSANKLASWVDDLLNHARIGHTEVKAEWVDLTKMVDDLCSQLQHEAWPFSSMKVLIQPNLVTTGDRVLVRIALRSLLENACKYSKQGQQLVLEIGETYVGRKSYLYIKDNGIGFDQKYASKIFEPFQRLHRDEEYEGSGIGLANVQRIIDRHGGEIFVESKPGVGSKFVFRFGSSKAPMDPIA